MNIHLALCFLPFSEHISFYFNTYSNILYATSSCVLNKLLSPISDEPLCSETDLFACLVELLLLLRALLLLHRQQPDQSLRNNWIIGISIFISNEKRDCKVQRQWVDDEVCVLWDAASVLRSKPVQFEFILLVHLRHDLEFLLEFLAFTRIADTLWLQRLLLPLKLFDPLLEYRETRKQV